MGGRNQIEVEPLNHRGYEGRMEVIGTGNPPQRAFGRPQEKQPHEQKQERVPSPAAAGSGVRGISFLCVDWRPFGQYFDVSFLSLLEFSVEDERWLDCEVQRS